MKVDVLTYRKKDRKTQHMSTFCWFYLNKFTQGKLVLSGKNLLVSLFHSQRVEENKLMEGVYRLGR